MLVLNHLMRSTTGCSSDAAMRMMLTDSDRRDDVSHRLTRTNPGGAHVWDGLSKVNDHSVA